MILQIQMAYGMPIPSVPFPYFYPAKLPTPIPPPNASSPDIKNFYPKPIPPPLNFSKREDARLIANSKHFQSDIAECTKKSDTDDSDNNLTKKYHQHEDNSRDAVTDIDCDMIEETENVEID